MTKLCKICKSPNQNQMAQVCSPKCALEYAKKNRLKKEKEAQLKAKRETKQKLKGLITRKEWYDKLQKLVNQWVKIRDMHEPCCTCSTTNPNIKYDAGHFIAVKRGGVDPRRFELTNIHKQCSVNCNQHGSGMRAEYRKFIERKYGKEHLDWLECGSNHKPLKEQFPHWIDIENEISRYRKMIRDAGFKPVV